MAGDPRQDPRLLPRGPHGTMFTDERKIKILDAFEYGATIQAACRRAGISLGCWAGWKANAANIEHPQYEDFRGFMAACELAKLEPHDAMGNVFLAAAHSDPKYALIWLKVNDPERFDRMKTAAVQVTIVGDSASVDIGFGDADGRYVGDID